MDRRTSKEAKRNLILGTVCCNCGTDCGKEIEYHHIVPLCCGGNDTVGNLAPLCPDCHSLVTFGIVKRTPERNGRRRRTFDAGLLDSVFTRYTNGELSEIDAKKELATGCHIKDMEQFREWAEEHGIDPKKRFGTGGKYERKSRAKRKNPPKRRACDDIVIDGYTEF